MTKSGTKSLKKNEDSSLTEIRQLVKDWRALASSVLEGRCRFSPKRLTEIEYLGFKRIRNWHFCREFYNDLANDKKIPISLIREAIRTQLFCCEYIGTSVTQAWERVTRSTRTSVNLRHPTKNFTTVVYSWYVLIQRLKIWDCWVALALPWWLRWTLGFLESHTLKSSLEIGRKNLSGERGLRIHYTFCFVHLSGIPLLITQ